MTDTTKILIDKEKVWALVAEAKTFIDCDGPDSWALGKAISAVEAEMNAQVQGDKPDGRLLAIRALEAAYDHSIHECEYPAKVNSLRIGIEIAFQLLKTP